MKTAELPWRVVDHNQTKEVVIIRITYEFQRECAVHSQLFENVYEKNGIDDACKPNYSDYFISLRNIGRQRSNKICMIHIYA